MANFSKLKRFTKRTYLSEKFQANNWPAIQKYYSQLEKEPVKTPEQLEIFLRRWNELGDIVEEEAAKRYALMTCDTADIKIAKSYEEFQTQIRPHLKDYDQILERKYFNSPGRRVFTKNEFALFDRKIAVDIKLYRIENTPLEIRESLLTQKYQQTIGAMTAIFDGKEQTLTQIAKILEEPDRERRKLAWETISKRRFHDAKALDRIFDDLKALRIRQANNAGFKNYRDYMFQKKYRFDYHPKDCFSFHEAVAKHFVPLTKKIQEVRKEKMKLDKLKPWDLAVDPENKPPLKPFTTTAELISGSIKVLNKVDPDFAEKLRNMNSLSLLDLGNRKGKAPGGYAETFPESRMPFIFMNAVGDSSDVRTLLHEAGHAMNSFAAKDFWLSRYRHPPMEFAEVASMGMELLTFDYLDEFYSPADQKRAQRKKIEEIVDLLCWIATVDSFQHWIYTNPNHTIKERGNKWEEICEIFNRGVDWSGYERFKRTIWHRQLHIFELPFYYIEYGIAQLGALQLWQNFRVDPKKTVAKYKNALSLGGSVPLPELFKTAGIKFQFDEKIISAMAKFLEKELKNLTQVIE